MRTMTHNTTSTQRRAMRVRGKMQGTADRPRLTVYRSNKHTYLQVIDDVAGVTIAAATEHMLDAKQAKSTKTERAVALAQLIVDQLKSKKVTKLCFDRGSYRYHGRVRAVADTLRNGGIQV